MIPEGLKQIISAPTADHKAGHLQSKCMPGPLSILRMPAVSACETRLGHGFMLQAHWSPRMITEEHTRGLRALLGPPFKVVATSELAVPHKPA